ncbi:MAG: hypothetical protein F4Z63_00315 [Gammaproteobacteria bacterium]|nr:hypothetical protein [Gammaproteobacteria bacterium]MYE26407.1 hypothetical protein [Chloroflexota bacterium]
MNESDRLEKAQSSWIRTKQVILILACVCFLLLTCGMCMSCLVMMDDLGALDDGNERYESFE